MLVECGVVLRRLARQYLAVRDDVQLVRELAAREREMRRQAFADPLTGLADRSLFRDRLEHVLELHTRDCRPVAVIFLDLDDFEAVNDGHGHAAGDGLLVRVAERITGATPRRGPRRPSRRRRVRRPARGRHRPAADRCPHPGGAGAGPRPRRSGAHRARERGAVTGDDPPVTVDALLARRDAVVYAVKRAGKAGVARFDAATGEAVPAGASLPAPARSRRPASCGRDAGAA
jgi:predicted signal transduction protein with EAL and GGDEF domain